MSFARRILYGPTEALARQSANPGQVAQLVERSPEKAGVGGSIPSLATILQQFTDGHPSKARKTLVIIMGWRK